MSRLLFAALAFLTLSCLPAAARSVDVVVYKSSQVMTVTVDGDTWYVWEVSTARKGKVTPVGTYRPQSFSIDHRSSLYDNAPMPYSVFFHGNYAIHGTYDIHRLGSPASAGCVRLHVDNAAELFHLIRDAGKGNTRIIVLD